MASSGSVNKDQRRVVKSIFIGHLSYTGNRQMCRTEYLLYVQDFKVRRLYLSYNELAQYIRASLYAINLGKFMFCTYSECKKYL